MGEHIRGHDALRTEVLFLDADFRDQLERAVGMSTKSVDVLVGFAKLSAMQWLANQVAEGGISVSVVVGWTMKDLAQESSDIQAYEFARSRGWKFGIRPELHAKIFWCDRDELLIGSANLTTRGLHLGAVGNIEAGVRITPTNIDKTKLNDLIAKSIWLDDQLFDDIRAQLASVEVGGESIPSNLRWPESIEAALLQMKKYLWVDDMFLTNPQSDVPDAASAEYLALIEHDRALLDGCYKGDSSDRLVLTLRETTVVQWLTTVLREQDDSWARFGTVTAALHNALMDDPKPYRRDVKSLLANLLAWIEFAKMPEFEFKKHRRTTSVHLVELRSPDGFGS